MARVLLDFVDGDGRAFPGQDIIAQRCNLVKRTVCRSLKRLEAAADDPNATFWIVVQKDWKNTYQVFYRPLAPPAVTPDYSDTRGPRTPPSPSNAAEREPIVELLRGEYLAARADKHKLDDYNGNDPDWTRLVAWTKRVGARLARPGEASDAAVARVGKSAMWRWLQYPGRKGRLDEERHPFPWIVYDLDHLEADLVAAERERDAVTRARQEEHGSSAPPVGWDPAANARAARAAMEAFTRRSEEAAA